LNEGKREGKRGRRRTTVDCGDSADEDGGKVEDNDGKGVS
jgi:hypothetical protein